MSSPEHNEKLARALRHAEDQRRVFIPPTINQSILNQAREHFEAAPKIANKSWIESLRRIWILLAPALAVMAIAHLYLNPPNPQFAKEDINQDGRIDILDALALTRAVDNTFVPIDFDQNGDRQLDESDVNAVAMAAVRLDHKGGSGL